MNYSDPNLLVCKPDWLVQTVADLKRHEGFLEYAYPDPLSRLAKLYRKEDWGKKPARLILTKLGESEQGGRPWTYGYGFTERVTVDSVITKQQAERKLEQLVMDLWPELDELFPGWIERPLFVQTVLLNMLYNLGMSRYSKFAPTLRVIKDGEYEEAGNRLTHSLWYSQVGNRAKELVARLRNRKVEPEHLVVKPRHGE